MAQNNVPLGKVAKIAIAIIAYLLFLFVTIALRVILSIWLYALIALILAIVTRLSLSGRKKKLLDYSAGIKSAAKLVFVAIFLFLMYTQGIAEIPDKIYDANELLKHKVSGDCRVAGNELVCNGPWKIFIPNKENIGKIKINPGSQMFKAMNIQAGHYLVEYSQGSTFYEYGGTVCGYAPKEGNYHRAMISYYFPNPNNFDKGEWGHAVGTCNLVSVPEGSVPQEIYFGTMWLRIPDGFLHPIHQPEDPQVFVGGFPVTSSEINVDNQVYLGGDITLSSSQGETIKNMEVIFSSYSLGEFISKTTKFG